MSDFKGRRFLTAIIRVCVPNVVEYSELGKE
jgi:hypothetical protein